MSNFVNKYLSISRLRLYEQCPRAFFFRYVTKAPSLPVGDAALFGVVLHAALEAFFRWVITEEYSGPLPVERLVDAYKHAWTEEERRDGSLAPPGIVGVHLYQEGLQILRMYAARHPPVDHFSILAVEQEFNIQVGEFVVNGFLDRVEKIADDHVAIVDYKSNRAMFTRDELATDLQASVYGLAARQLYPWAKRISFVFDMLRHDTKQEAVRSVATIDDAAGYVVVIGRRTESDKDWVPRLNEFCSYCDYRTRCEAYQSVMRGEVSVPTIAKDGDLEGLLAAREVVSRFAKLAYARQKEIDAILKKKVAEEGPFGVGGFNVRIIPAFDTSYPRTATVEAFVEFSDLRNGDAAAARRAIENRLFVVDKGKVEELLAETLASVSDAKGHLVKATIAALAEKTPATGRIDVRREKTAKSVASLAKASKTKALP